MLHRIRLISAMTLMVVSQAFAAGLGEIQVQSWLGQRLQARVPLLGLQDGDTSSLRVQLASVRRYQQLGVEFPSVLHSVQFEFEQNVLLISTNKRVNEPILELVLLLETPNGTVQRQFSVLLDLPPLENPLSTPLTRTLSVAPATTFANDFPTISAANATTARTNIAAVSAPQSAPRQSPTVVPELVVAAANHSTAVTTPNSYGPVVRSETLWSIANRLRPQLGRDAQTIMNGLYRANPQAFVNHNINRLMEGSRLQIPTEWPATDSVFVASAVAADSSSLAAAKTASAAAHTPAPNVASTSVANTVAPSSLQIADELQEQNRQLRGEIAQLTQRMLQLETRVAEQDRSSAGATNINAAQPISAPVTATTPTRDIAPTNTPTTTTQPTQKSEVIAAPIADKPLASESSFPWLWASLAALMLLAAALIIMMVWMRRSPRKALLEESVWQERKRSARVAKIAEKTIPVPSDWYTQETPPEPPNTAEAMEIRLQYVRSAIDTFLLFQRYGEALAFIRREIFEAGHDSPLGYRLDVLYRETREHLQSLGIDEALPSGETKIEMAAQRAVNEEHPVVTPLHKKRHRRERH